MIGGPVAGFRPGPRGGNVKPSGEAAAPAGPLSRAGKMLCAGGEGPGHIDLPSSSATRSAMELDTELKWKRRPGYSLSSTPSASARSTVPSRVSTGALK